MFMTDNWNVYCAFK